MKRSKVNKNLKVFSDEYCVPEFLFCSIVNELREEWDIDLRGAAAIISKMHVKFHVNNQECYTLFDDWGLAKMQIGRQKLINGFNKIKISKEYSIDDGWHKDVMHIYFKV